MLVFVGYNEEVYENDGGRRMSEIRYSQEGFWVEKKETHYIIGLSDKGQDDLGEVSFVDLPAEGLIQKDEVLIGVEAAKAVTELPAPVSGTIIEVNEGLEDDPSQLDSPDIQKNWIVKMTAVSEEAFLALGNQSGL